MKVLIAEDSRTVRVLLEGQLKSWGYDPVSAANGKEALDILNSDDAPRLAILDWQMPEADGVEVCRRIKEDLSRDFTYIIILSTVESLLGKGAYATVWKAIQNATGQQVALKILRMDLSTDGIFSRFAREIKLMEKLCHPNIAQIYDSKIDRTIGYCAMELIDGMPLQRYMKDHTVKKPQMFDIVYQLCKGLEHAHQNGIIHRDVKPSNIMMTSEGKPKLVDFGLGRNMFRPDSDRENSQTMEGYVVGTPMYMAPEQARGENDRLDGRADIYSLGTILYITLVRRHPYDIGRECRSDAIKEVAHGVARRPSEFKPDFDPELERILMKSLAHAPDDRYQSAREMGTALKQYADANL